MVKFRIEVHNDLSRIIDAPPRVLREIDRLTSYPIEGAQWTPAFKARLWDGKEHLLRKSRQGYHLLPTGLLGEVAAELDLDAAEWADERRKPGSRAPLEWEGPELRDYQTEAVEAALAPRGPHGWFGSRGLLNLPIRSGKTVIAAALIQRTGLRTLFAVPSDLLLYQSRDVFQRHLPGADVGLAGDGIWEDDRRIVVATVQSLLARKKRAAQLLAKSDLLIIDEAHHLEGPAWRALLLRSDAPLKIGLSATVFVSRVRACQRSSIWLKACTGPILHRVSMRRLIESGHVVRPRIVFYECEQPIGSMWSWQKIARDLVARSTVRNDLIATIASRACARGMRTMIDTGRKDQMKELHLRCLKSELRSAMIHGATSSSKRRALIDALRAGELDVLVGTVLGEGIDIPELDCVINAEGQKSGKAAIQRMRNLTPSSTKNGEVLFVDVADVGNKVLAKHSLERLKLYMGIRGFRVQVGDLSDPGDPLHETERE